MLNVFLTVDTEVWPFSPGWPVKRLSADKLDFSAEVEGYILGRTSRGNVGLPYQIEVLRRSGLKATYFVEALFAGRAGEQHLCEIVRVLQEGGQDVQLHVHTEWLGELSHEKLPSNFRQHIRQFSEFDQTRIIARGINNLRDAGATNVCAFRAGNFGANFDTLRALANNGIHIDSSYNSCFLDAECQMRTVESMLQPRTIHGVCVFPVTTFVDFPGHERPAQLCACSFQELTKALLQAWRNKQYSFVIVWHPFELMKDVRNPAKRRPDLINVRRFERLCEFLSNNRDKFRSSTFSDVDILKVPVLENIARIRSPLRYTAWRYAEQIASRLL